MVREAVITAKRLIHPLYINGRFLTQPFSGVQRFATEISAALIRLSLSPTLLIPPNTPAGDFEASSLRVGRFAGQVWEQVELPFHASKGILLNLGNTGPLRLRRQIVVIHDCAVFTAPESYSWRFRTWYKAIQRRLVSAGIPIVTVSKFSRSEIVRHLGVPAEQIKVVPEGGEHILRVIAEPNAISEAGLQPGHYVLAVGNLAANKNLTILGDLARALAARGMTLAITGAIDPTVFKTSEQSPLPQPAVYLGRVSNGFLRSLYESAACFVFPSYYEGFGLPLLEAMACNCPVVASDIPASREVADDCALYCDPFCPADFVAAVTRVIDEPGLGDTLRAASAKRLTVFNWDNAARSLVEVAKAFEGNQRETRSGS